MKIRLLTTLLLAGFYLGNASGAEAVTGRLARVRDTGTLVVAHSETAIPFSYVDSQGPKGYGVELSQRIAQAIQKELGMDKLTIRWNPVTLSTRFPMMVTNTVDLGCITTTHTRDREKYASFSTTFHIAHEGIASGVNSGINGFADLAGKRIAVVRNTTTESSLRARGLGDQLVLERSNRSALAAVVDGRADAYVAASALATGELALLDKASNFRVVATNEGREAYACFLPKGDEAFKRVVDRAITGLMQSGEMAKMYQRWFEQPIPPFGRALNVPLHADDQNLFQAPNDTPLE